MRLKRTFADYYDHLFDYGSEGKAFVRVGGNTGPPKREQFRILEAAGFRTPPHGTVGDVLGTWWEVEKQWVKAVVAYTDEMAHCAEGKRLYLHGELKSNPDMGAPGGNRYWREYQLYCSAFVGNHYCRTEGVSWRRLQVGPQVFWVEYRSTTSWMSNLEGECAVIGVERNAGFHPHIRRPLFAVDFVIGREMYAVDLNYAPGIRHSGVEDLLPAEEAVRAITSWFEEFGDVEE
jgi:hypothetical protein